MRKRNHRRDGHGASGISIPERSAILRFLERAGRPRTLQHIADGLAVRDDGARAALGKRLAAMERDGQVIHNRRGGFGIVGKMDLIAGRVIGHPDGFGFLSPDDKSGDLFLGAQEMRAVLHGDRVVVRVQGQDRQGRHEAAIVEVTERSNARVVGRFVLQGDISYVVPDNRRISQDVLIPAESRGNARAGQVAVAEIVTQPNRHMQPIGRIVEVLGDHAAPGMASEIAIRAFELPYEWPGDVDAEAAAIDPSLAPSVRSRMDLRDLPFVTIDGEDARDFDDAVYCEPRADGWRLLVAIADVAHYVRPDSPLDQEARNRGNSVYFPDRVIPMLPEVLSNELCSLKPEVDRLAMVCEMQVSAKGKVRDSTFHEGVIRSAARLTYTEVARIVVDREPAACQAQSVLVPHLDNLYSLFLTLHRRRRKRAVLEFDSTESRVRFDAAGRIASIQEVVRNDAHRLIEEFMLAANVAAAELLETRKIPILYRNHELPKAEKLAALRQLLGELGLELGGGEEPETRDYARLSEAVKGRPDAHLIRTLMLRSLPLAVYGADNVGHFGLAFPAYAHFTSPIRRYPDLLVHRALRHALGARRAIYPYSELDMQGLGEHCSMTERRADEATRDALQRLKCEYMLDKVGQVFSGTISGVAAFGLFVELDDIFVEGMIHVTSLPSDYYHFDPIRHVLKGGRRGVGYRLGGRVTVQVARVDADEKKIDFELQQESGQAGGRDHGRRRRSRRQH
ncbi:MAG: ribonuclease R [Gammaproteobacteria bacterium]|nr:ribonuclease R [Gammaproteobacteria bacterium]